MKRFIFLLVFTIVTLYSKEFEKLEFKGEGIDFLMGTFSNSSLYKVIGKPFKHENVEHEKITLVLMLTPYIIEQSADLTKLREELGKLYILEKTYVQQLCEIN